MVRLCLVVALVATAVLFAGVSAASANESPLAEAGLDQTVDNGTTVYLDAGGSVDPDGTIAAVRWTVTDPDGAAVTTADDASVRTSFTPTQTGNYTANLSVTDDDGASAEDTLYVTVEERDGPEVTLTGPGQTAPGDQTEFTVSATAGDADLRQLYWLENGSHEETVALSGDESTVSLDRSFDESGPLRLEATVIDTKGYSQTSSLRIQVRSGGGGTYDHCPDGGSPYFVEGDFVGCNDGGADMIYEDRVLEANGESGISLRDTNGGPIHMVSEEQVEELRGGSNGAPTRDEISQTYEENLERTRMDITFENVPRRFQDRSNSQGSGSTEAESSGSGDTSSTTSSRDNSPNTPPFPFRDLT